MGIYILLLIISPVLSIPINLIALLKNPLASHAKWHALLFAIGFAFIADHIVPDLGMDLYRYFQRMDQMADLSSLDAIRMEIEQFNTEFISYYLMYLISKTNLYGLYPAISTLYTYSVCLYIALQVVDRYGYSKSEARFLIVILLSWLASDAIVSGIRYNMAFTTLLIACYMDFILERKRPLTYAIYGATILIHSSFIVFIALRVLCLFMKSNKIIRFGIFVILGTWSLYFGSIADFASDVSFYNDGYLADKLDNYNVVHTGGRIGKFIIRYSKLIISALISYVLIKKYEEEKNRKDDMNLFNASNSLLVLGSLNRLIYVSRFFQVLSSFAPFFIIHLFRNSNETIYRAFIVILCVFFFYDQMSLFGIKLSDSLLSLCFQPIFNLI